MIVKWKKLKEGAILPEYKREGDAGMDLACREEFVLDPGGLIKIDLGFAVEIPEGFEMQIRSRSSLASNGVIVMNQPGTVDSGYRGEIGVLLLNMSPNTIAFPKGERIAQAVFNKFEAITWEESEELLATDRGEGGFGSTNSTIIL